MVVRAKHPAVDTPLKSCYSLTERPGHLRLFGNCYDLSSPEAPAMLLRKQTSFHDRFQATMEFNPRKRGYHAGLVLWWNQFSFATVGISMVEAAPGKAVRTAVLRSPTGRAGDVKVRIASRQMRKFRKLRRTYSHN